MPRPACIAPPLALLGWILLASTGQAEPAAPAASLGSLENISVRDYRITTTLQDALAKLSQAIGREVRADWRALDQAGVKRDAPVLLQGKETTAADLLDQTLLQVKATGKDLGWYLAEDGSVVLTSAQRARIGERALEPPPTSRPASQAATSQPTSQPSAAVLQWNPDQTARLDDLVNLIRRQTKINLVVNWHALRASGITRQSKVSLQLRNGTIGQVLDLALRELSSGKDRLASAYWIIDEGLVLISTGRELNKRLQTRTYEVGPLLLSQPASTRLIISRNQAYIRNLVPIVGPRAVGYEPVIGTCISGVRLEMAGEGITRAQKKASLEKVVRNLIDPEMWQPIGKGSISFFDTRMVVTQTLLGWKLMERSARGVLSD